MQDGFEFHVQQFMLSARDNGQLLDIFSVQKINK